MPSPAASDRPDPEVDRWVDHGGVALLRSHRLITAYNLDRPLVPASIWKIATARAAFSCLGQAYRFATAFFLSADGELSIKGYGDPFLVSEEIATIAGELKAAGVGSVSAIRLDDSYFAIDRMADGTGTSLNPYDAANSALAVNFNTVNVEVAADGSVRSAEPQTPTLPLMAKLAAGLPAGRHRINIGLDRQTILRHTGELFAALLSREGIAVRGPISPGRAPAGQTPLLVHRSSRDLTAVVEAMMRYSNNFIANQLFLACGAERHGAPATWRKGRQALARILGTETGLPASAFRVEEGSGLSRSNRITPRAMLALLDAFRLHAHLLPLEHGARVKSGTLTGVYSFAGYFQGPTGPDPFVIILNQGRNTRDRLLRLLARRHAAAAP